MAPTKDKKSAHQAMQDEVSGDYPTPVSLQPNGGSFQISYPYSSGDTIPDEVSARRHGSILQGISDYARQSSHVTRAESERTTFTETQSRGDDNDRGFTAPNGLDVVGRGIRKLMAAINELDQLGIESDDLLLPKVVVVGDQSAGKSSLIEAISEIKVPRDVGTCTRCPLHITLKGNDEVNAQWECEVALLKKYDYFPDFVPSEEFQKDYPFHPWRPRDTPELTPFMKTKNKNDLEGILRWAQVATLNPQENPSKYVDGSRKNLSAGWRVTFSPNIVQLEITGPHLPNLSFYDLPGVINQTERTTDRHFVEVVKNMVREYIRPERTLVLLAVSMEGDPQNSTASSIVREMHADHRCVGVLTKPDRLPVGDPVDIWESILNGEKFPLAYQYFVTKQPSKASLDSGITHALARKDEELFFSEHEPWKSTFAAFKSRFGTFHLQSELSVRLQEQILESLEPMSEKIREKLNDISLELATLPEPPTDAAVRIILETLGKFDLLAQRCIEGELPVKEFKVEWRAEARKFRKDVVEMRPVLVVGTPAEATWRRSRGEASSPPAAPKREPAPEPVTVPDDSDVESVQPSPKKKRKVEPETSRPTSQRTARRPLWKRLTLKLPDIRKTLHDFTSSELPNETDPRAIKELIKLSVENWDKPMSEFLDVIGQRLRARLQDILDDAFVSWRSTDFYKETSAAIDTFLFDKQSQLRGLARLVYEMEILHPLAQDEEMSELNRVKELRYFQEARHEARASRYLDEIEQVNCKEMTGLQRAKKLKDVTPEKLGADPYQREVEAMARVRAYYNIASSRFIDHVCQVVHNKFFEDVRAELHRHVTDALRIFEQQDAQPRCTSLLADDPARERRRMQLVRERASLMKALDTLAGLHVGQI